MPAHCPGWSQRKSAHRTFSGRKIDEYRGPSHKVAIVSVFPLLEINKLVLVLNTWKEDGEEGRKEEKWREEDEIQRKEKGKIITGNHNSICAEPPPKFHILIHRLYPDA